jgi:hypothetical protein
MTEFGESDGRPEEGGFGEALGGDPGYKPSVCVGGIWVERDDAGSSLFCEAVEEEGPVFGAAGLGGCAVVEEGDGEGDELEEKVVEFVLVPDVGPELGADGGDGGGVEAAGGFREARGEVATGADSAGAAGGGVLGIEEGVGHGVDQLVREDAGDWGVDGEAGDGAVGDSLEDFEEAFEVHRFGEGVLHYFADQRVIGDFYVAGHGFGAGGGVREDAGQEVVGAGALDLRGYAFALLHAEQLEGASGGPAPAVLEERRRDAGLLEEFAGGEGGEEVEDVGEGEAVLLGEGDVDAVVGGGGLEFEVEAAAEALAQG